MINMCKYCESGKDINLKGNESEMDARMWVDPDEKEMVVLITQWHKEISHDYYSPDELVDEEFTMVFEANYCPMCGRKLGENEEEE